MYSFTGNAIPHNYGPNAYPGVVSIDTIYWSSDYSSGVYSHYDSITCGYYVNDSGTTIPGPNGYWRINNMGNGAICTGVSGNGAYPSGTTLHLQAMYSPVTLTLAGAIDTNSSNDSVIVNCVAP